LGHGIEAGSGPAVGGLTVKGFMIKGCMIIIIIIMVLIVAVSPFFPLEMGSQFIC